MPLLLNPGYCFVQMRFVLAFAAGSNGLNVSVGLIRPKVVTVGSSLPKRSPLLSLSPAQYDGSVEEIGLESARYRFLASLTFPFGVLSVMFGSWLQVEPVSM